MAGYWRTLLSSGVLLCSLMIEWGHAGEVSIVSSQNDPESPEFVLPQKHLSDLTQSEQTGQALYRHYCTICHGLTGQGDGFNSFNLSTPPAKHADPARMATRSDGQIQKVIKEGGTALGMSPLMPPWGTVLKDSQIVDLCSYIRTLTKQKNGKK
jgi:mono/diheme cytochrome c family protein